MYTDSISDFLTRIRNAQAAGHDALVVSSSRMKLALARILEAEGYVVGVREEADGPKKTLHVSLKYEGKMPKIRSLSRVSKPGRRVYKGSKELPVVLSDQGIAIISTSAGVMTNKEARRRKLGGEVLCEIT